MRRLTKKEKVPFKRSRWLLLKNPWNLNADQKERLSTLARISHRLLAKGHPSWHN
jgi:hypothetical protein